MGERRGLSKRGTRGTSILYVSYRPYQTAGSDVTLAYSLPRRASRHIPFPFRPVARSVDRVIYEHHRREGYGGSGPAGKPSFSFFFFSGLARSVRTT